MPRRRRFRLRPLLTRNEALTLTVLCALFSIGLVARHIQQRAARIDEGAYDEMDRRFFEQSADTARGTGASAPAGVPAGTDTPAVAGKSGADAASNAAIPALRSGDAPPVAASSTQRIDVNTAGMADLERLPRIGPRMAERIVAFRETYGPFHDVDDLVQVSGIGPKTIELLRPLVRVEADSRRP